MNQELVEDLFAASVALCHQLMAADLQQGFPKVVRIGAVANHRHVLVGLETTAKAFACVDQAGQLGVVFRG